MADDGAVFDLLGDGAPDPKAPKGEDAPGGPAPGGDSAVFDLLGPQDGGASPAGPQAPAAPPGPPRLRGQALTPPPAPRPTGGAPAAPEDLSLGAVAKGAWENAPASIWNNLKQTVEPLLPQNWESDVRGVKALATDPNARAAVAKMYTDRYGSVDNLLRTLKHDPAAVGSDVAALATIPAGGEGLAAKIPGAAGDVLGAVAKGAKIAQTADPTVALARGAGLGLRGAGAAVSALPAPVRQVAGAGARRLVGMGAGHVVGNMIPGAGHFVGPWAGEQIAASLDPLFAGKSSAAAAAAKQFPNLGAQAKQAMGASGIAAARASKLNPLIRTSAVPLATAAAGLRPVGGQPPDGGPPAPGPAPAAADPDAAPPAGPDPDAGADPRDRFRAMYSHFASGMTDDQIDALLQEPELKGLYDAKPAATAQPLSSGLQGAPLRAPRGAMYGHIADIASRAGANDGEIATLQQIARVESGGNPNASSPSGRYHGLFQYTNGGDPEADTVRALGDMRRNEQRLRSMGVGPDAGALYVMHQQGAGGGPALLTAAPGTKAIDAIARLYGSRATARQAIAHNIGINYRTPGGEAAANAAAENMTAADFVNLWRNKLTGVPFADGGRVERAAGGNVVNMTEHLLRRAQQAQKAEQSSTKPLLALSDDTVAHALRVASRGL